MRASGQEWGFADEGDLLVFLVGKRHGAFGRTMSVTCGTLRWEVIRRF